MSTENDRFRDINSHTSLWSLSPDIAYLNHGAYGAVPGALTAVAQSLRSEMERNPLAFLYRSYPDRYLEARNALAQFIDADREHLVFIPNATHGMEIVLNAFLFTDRAEILVTNHGYPWVRQALLNLSSQGRVTIREAAISLPATPDAFTRAIAAHTTAHTELIIIDHVTSPTALVLPVKEVVDYARSQHIPVLVDGAHAPGAIPLSVSTVDADFYVGNLHKWCCAPRGSGFLAFRSEWLDRLRPLSLTYREGRPYHHTALWPSWRFEWHGTFDPVPWLCTPEVVRFWSELGLAAVQTNNREKALRAASLLCEEIGAARISGDEMVGSMVALRLPVPAIDEALRSLSTVLAERHFIEVPCFRFEDHALIRISAQLYNSEADYRRLVEGLKRELS